MGADRLLLEVRENNAGAIGFYAAHGFVEIDRRPRYYRRRRRPPWSCAAPSDAAAAAGQLLTAPDAKVCATA